jgi:hypothetical protein
LDKGANAVNRAVMMKNPFREDSSRSNKGRREKELSSSSESDEEYEQSIINKYREQLEKKSPQKRLNPETSRYE